MPAYFRLRICKEPVFLEMIFRKILFQGVLSLLISPLFAQHSSSGAGLNLYGGFISGHHDFLQQLDGHVAGLEFRYTLAHGPDAPEWARRLRLPRSGFALLLMDLGNPEVTGKAIALIPHQEFRMISARTGSMYFRLGTGLTWLTKRYDPVENRKQIAIGAHINPVMQFSFVWHQRIIPGWEADLGGGLTHFSNGNFNLPNFGMNIPNLHAGITHIYGHHEAVQKLLKASGPWKSELDLSISGATKEEGIVSFTRYYIWGLSGKYQVHRNGPSRFMAGAEFFWDNAYTFYTRSPKTFPNVSEFALTAGHRLVLGKLHLFTEMGFYLSRPTTLKKPWFQRLGLNYMLPASTYLGVCLKTHLAQSDYIQFTLGKFLNLKK